MNSESRLERLKPIICITTLRSLYMFLIGFNGSGELCRLIHEGAIIEDPVQMANMPNLLKVVH